jgi:hypothetical protein
MTARWPKDMVPGARRYPVDTPMPKGTATPSINFAVTADEAVLIIEALRAKASIHRGLARSAKREQRDEQEARAEAAAVLADRLAR